MAGYCSKCGAALPPNAAVCSSCGTPVGSDVGQPTAAQPGAPPAASAPSPAGYGAQAAGHPGAATYPPPKKSNNTLKIILITIAVIVGLGIVSVGVLGFVGWRALHRAGNTFSMGKNADVSEADLGVPIYPGATGKAGAAMRMNVAGNSVVTATYLTNDSKNSVLDFYRSKLGGSVTEGSSAQGASLSSSRVDGNVKESIVVTVGPAAQADGASTRVTILHSKAVTH